MRRIIRKRSLRRRAVAGLVVAAAVAATASIAIAQAVPAPDGGPPHAGAIDPPKTTNCAGLVDSTVITQNDPMVTNEVGSHRLPGAVKQFTVQPGQSRCIKLLFTAETACGPSAAPDFCYVRALIDGLPMDPDGTQFQAIDSEDGSASAHAYEWVKRVGPGNHVVELQRRVLAPATQFYIDDWTFDVQQYL